VGETLHGYRKRPGTRPLSVSSNGSTWVKLPLHSCSAATASTFSILERIDVGETYRLFATQCSFSR